MSAPSARNKAKDHRPKVISFRTALDGLNIAASQSVLWPCHAFNISIPQKKKSGLNVFEETVLKITEIESGDTEKIALLTCLENELVAFIQNRLNQLGLLNDRYELSEEGKRLLESWHNKDEASVEYAAGTVFVDLHTGKLLPFIHMGSLTNEKIKSFDDDFITVEIGSTGKSTSQRCRLIRPSQNSYWKTVPDSNDIIRAIREFKKKYKRYALLNQGVDQYPPPVPMAGAISINENPELVYLHCNVLIQIGNSDLLVTDGCSFGFSESFANYLTSQDWKWVRDIKKKGIVDRFALEKKNATYSKDDQWRYPNVTSLFRHPEYGINSALEKLNDSPKTEHEEREYVSNKQQIGSKLYSSVEYALALVVAEYPVPEWEQIFSSQDYENNERLLHGFAKKIGFSLSYQNKKLLQVKAGAIRHIQHGKVKLQPLLAIAIAGTATKYPTHPVRDLARNHSGFLDFALSLKKLRDPVSHGDISDYKKDTEQLKDDVNRTVGVITTLLPAISSELSDSNQRYDIEERDINQERLKAETQLDKFFGLSFVCEMEKGQKEQLIRIECMFAQPLDDLMTVEIFKALASAIQTSLQQKLRDRSTIETSNSEDVKEIALNKIIEAGFYETRNEIPKSLSTVRSGFIKKSIGGYGASLGADLLGLIFVASDYEIQCLYQADAHIIRFTADLLSKRGDGNTLSAVLSRDDMESLKNNVFKAIKIITEVF